MKKILSFFAAVLLVAFAANAKTIEIGPESPGGTCSNKLIYALADAEDNDVIVLADGTYNENDNYIVIDKAVEIKAAEGAKPVVEVETYIKIDGTKDIKIQGIKFDATKQGPEGTSASSYSYFIRNYAAGTIELDGCEFCNSQANPVILADKTNINFLKINNCYFHDGNNSVIKIASGSSAHACAKIAITNSTFANYGGFNNGLLSIQSMGGAKAATVDEDVEVVMDHCTFYNISKTDAGSTYGVLDIRKSANATVNNCIFADPAELPDGAAAFHRATQMYGGTVSNCLVFNTPGHRSDDITINNPVSGDPLFKDAANGDYTLVEGSPALGAGTDESNLGDPRWWPAEEEEAEPQTLYLNLTSSADWAGYTKNFAVYYFDETKNGWSDMMTAVPEKENIYTTTIPAGFSKVIFVRFKSDATTPRWDAYNDEWYVWSQTINLEIPEGKDQFTVDGGNSGKDCTGSWSKYGETPQPEEIKYYLVGSFNGWTASDEYLFEASESEDGQFELAVTLAEYDEFKVKSSKNVWYPDGNENNYKVDANHAGDKTVLFRPDGEGGEGWYEGVIYVEANPVVLEAPDAAPAAPTSEAYQVKAVYSAKYSADCSFGYWDSGTQYAQEDYGKKFVTAASGYFGLEFSSHLDCSEMEALHLDAWIAEDASIHVVPIHGGAEVGVTVNLKGQQWNSIDIDLKKFEGVTNWSNVYQIKIDEAANLTFWLNNVYFYTTQTKTIDLVDGYYLIGTMNSWDIHNMTAADKFAVNPENDKEYKLTTTLAENDEFKVVEVANNAIVEGKWFPAEAGNYKVDFDHSGENKDIYFRPDYEGGEGWHAGCIFVAESVGNNPWTTYFAVGDTWNEEKESYLEWDADNEKTTIHIAVDKNGQWRAQAKYRGPIAEAGKYYRVSLKMKANNAIQNVTIKYQDNDQGGAEMVLVTDAALEAGVEFVFDRKVAGTDNGNGIMVLDFGFAKAGDIIEIYDVVIEEVFAKFYIAGNMTSWGDNKIPVFEDSYILEDLAAGKYQMKVVDGADWLGIKALTATADNLYIDQDGNICFILAEAGDVTVTFKKIEDEISAFTVTGNFVAPEIKLIGIKGWEEDTDAIAFESGTTEASVKLTLDGDWYNFKLIRADDWLGKENEGEQNYRIHSEYNFVDGLVRNYEGLKSISLQPDGAGVYEFVYEYATGKLQVNFPQEDPSAIENSEVAVKVQKLIENGQIVIIRNGEKFNAQGQLIR